ncbi:NAD-dependent succinate-semialdehyde dehydrogenase [Streptomyces sp. BH106]|uniref:NAD-dependent succinate-semialdehyde dehydrogenase n=1 Tax=Streptomyces sp. BH106 TaxID=3410409 RepID=UPI003CF63927
MINLEEPMSVEYAVTNPATGRVETTVPTMSAEEMQSALKRSVAAFAEWRSASVAQRAEQLAAVAGLFRERRGALAQLITREMGKPNHEALGEVALVADIFQYYADQGPSFLAESEFEPMGGGKAVLRKEPLGSILGVMPWNFPYYQVARFAAPTLVAGNAVIVKHAPQCPESAMAIEEIFRDAGLPQDVYINVFATNEQVADMIADPRIMGVSVTGSERAGTAVAEVAAKNLKKVVLELGGSDALIVLDSPDLAKTVAQAAASRMFNAGQACNSPKRMIVAQDIYDEFLERLVAAVGAVKWGDPSDPGTTVGPMASLAAADRLVTQVKEAVSRGATLHVGGNRVDGAGAYVEPAVLSGITPDMPTFHEELFGPVAVVYAAASVDEAVDLANNSPFGLGASVFSADTDKAVEVAARLDTGMVWINSPEGSAPDLPFGGVKRSGIGRELGALGIDEFVNKKTVYIP